MGRRRNVRIRLVIGSAVLVGAITALLLARVRTSVAAAIAVLLVAGLTAACVRLLLRGSRPVRGVVALAAGLLGVAEGVGVLVPHIAARGAMPFTVAAALAVGAGVVLLVTGVQELMTAAHGWWRLLTVTAAAVGTVVALLTLPFAVAATAVPHHRVGTGSPGDLGLTYRDVTFPASDGVQLSGWYVPSTGSTGPAPAVVLLHGSGSTRTAVLDHAAALAGRGYAVLLFDARGHGDSAGTAMDFGWSGDADIHGAVTFLTGQAGVDSSAISAVGMSMGGEEAIGAAGADPRIRAVVAEGATHRVAADKSWQADRYGAAGIAQGWLDAVTYGAAALLSAVEPPDPLRASAFRAAPRPILLITAGERPDEALAADDIRAASPNTISVWDVPGADHVGALAADPQAWTDRVDAFLSAASG